MATLRGTGRVRSITAEDLAARLLAGWAPRLIDVRTAWERRREPYRGSSHVPLALALAQARWWTQPTVVICRTGHRAELVAARSGSNDTFVLEGGVRARQLEATPRPTPGGPAGLDALLAAIDLAGMRSWRRASAVGLRGDALEVGAGTGRNTRHVPKGVRLVAVEPDGAALRYRRERSRDRGLAVAASAEALPFRDGSFDSALMTLVMCSVDDQRAVAGELFRVLRPGASLFAVDHVISPWRFARLIQRAWAPAWYRRTGSCRIDRDTLAELTAAGFRVRREARRAFGVFVRYRATKPVR